MYWYYILGGYTIKEFNFTEILGRIPEATQRKNDLKVENGLSTPSFIEDPSLKYRIVRENIDTGHKNTRYELTKKDLYIHLRNIGYSHRYIMDSFDKFPREIEMITDDKKIIYKIRPMRIEIPTKYNVKAYKVNIKDTNEDHDYFIDENLGLYRRNNRLGRITKINKIGDEFSEVNGINYDLKKLYNSKGEEEVI